MNRILAILTGSLAVLIAAEALLAQAHYFVGFHAAVGVASCVLVVFASKALGKTVLQRPEERDDS